MTKNKNKNKNTTETTKPIIIQEKWSDYTFFEKLFYRTAQVILPIMMIVSILALLRVFDKVEIETPTFIVMFFAPIAWYIIIFKLGQWCRKRRLKKIDIIEGE